MNYTYVVGHVNPDTDSIASAVGYAWLLNEKRGDEYIAARAGAINPQTTWVLKRLGLDTPELLTDASPRFETVTRRLDTANPNSALRDAWAILNRTGGVAPIVDPEDGKPTGLITGLSLFNLFGRLVGPYPERQDARIADILDLPCHEATDTSVPRFQGQTRIRDVLTRVFREEHNYFLIIGENDTYIGVAQQRDVLNPPRLQVILVDHNEPNQSIWALEEAELIEILDHHRLGNMSTHMPIRFSVDVVGSTSTLVSERIEESGLSAPPEIAGLLLAGLISDTLTLKSPTTTKRDRNAADRMARWAFVPNSPLSGETIESYGEQILVSGAGLSARDPEKIVNSDLKIYEAGGYHFAVAQAEVTDLLQISDHLGTLINALDNLMHRRGLDFSMLMITDVVKNSSRLLMVNSPPILEDLPYPRLHDGTRRAEGVVSRKKQLLPTLLGLLEE